MVTPGALSMLSDSNHLARQHCQWVRFDSIGLFLEMATSFHRLHGALELQGDAARGPHRMATTDGTARRVVAQDFGDRLSAVFRLAVGRRVLAAISERLKDVAARIGASGRWGPMEAANQDREREYHQ